MPLQATSGAASYDAFGGGVPVEPVYIEQIFSTYLYTGNGSTQTITNGIDLSTKGGLVWIKQRNQATSHRLFDTARGVQNSLASNSTAGTASFSGYLTAFNSNGFSVGSANDVNESGYPLASWTFRKQPKFFDVVTYTGTGSTRTVSHSLGSVPAFMIIKRTDAVANWVAYHISLGAGKFMRFNTTDAAVTNTTTIWANTSPTSTVFTVGTDTSLNASGGTYVAYLFAHDAGGFGLTGTDNVISCGSYTGTGTSNSINLGYEAQWVMIKRTDTSSQADWVMFDTMRGMVVPDGDDNYLFANTSGAESAAGFPGWISPTATGFRLDDAQGRTNASGGTYIYIAIRRGPMRVPTTGTSVYNAIVRNGTQANATVTGVGFPVDLAYTSLRPAGTHNPVLSDRLRGAQRTLSSRGTQAEQSEPLALTSFASMDGVSLGADNTGFWNGFNSEIGLSYVNWFFRRAPSFFDEVCYTGTGSARTVTHNLGAVPELMIMKNRSTTGGWYTYAASLGASNALQLNLSDAALGFGYWNNTAPTASVFSTGAGSNNDSGVTYVAYLFATCAGVQYINSYVGDGTTGRTINCGFAGGARFVGIKATSTSGSWWTFDSARGIVTNNDPALQLNSTAAEVTSADAIDTASSGFIVNQEATCSLNASGVTYLVWAIA